MPLRVRELWVPACGGLARFALVGRLGEFAALWGNWAGSYLVGRPGAIAVQSITAARLADRRIDIARTSRTVQRRD
jgi:hypothetical protein